MVRRWQRAVDRAGWPRTLHGRLLGLVSAVSLVTIVGLGAISVVSDSQVALEGLRQQAAAEARGVAMASLNPMLTEQLDELDTLVMRHADFPGVVSVHLLGDEGRVLSHAARDADGKVQLVFEPGGVHVPPPDEALGAQIETWRQPSPGYLVAWHPVSAGRVVGWARVEQSLAPLHDMRRQVWWRTGVAGVLAVLLGGGLLWRLLRAPMRALDDSRRFAEALAQADGRQLPVDAQGPMETVALGHALNQASQRLGEQRHTIAATLSKLQHNQALLQDSNLALRAMFALSPDGLVAFDAAGRVHHVNPAFSRITGLDGDALLGHPMLDLDDALTGRKLPDAAPVRVARYFEPDPAAQANSPTGHVLVLDGAPPVVLQVLGVVAEDGGTVRRLLYLRDVTRETEVDRLKSEFLSTAAHELRTPIASIHGFAELLQLRDYPPDRQRQMLDKIHRNSGVLVHILNDLLDLSRIEAQRGKHLQRQPLDLGDLVAQLLADQAPPEGRSPALLHRPDGELPVDVDGQKIGQVLRNLLANAYKYSPAGGPVEVRLAREGPAQAPDWVLVDVIDRGIGMAPEQVARVFERFYRADPSGTVLGAGLGMSIVKEIIDLHGGCVTVDSTPGQGTRVQVRLPGARAPGSVQPVVMPAVVVGNALVNPVQGPPGQGAQRGQRQTSDQVG